MGHLLRIQVWKSKKEEWSSRKCGLQIWMQKKKKDLLILYRKNSKQCDAFFVFYIHSKSTWGFHSYAYGH